MNLRRCEGIVKVVGIVVCIFGVVIMLVYKGFVFFGGGNDIFDVGIICLFENLGVFFYLDIV